MKKTILTAIAVAASAAQAVVLNSRDDLTAGTASELTDRTIYDVKEDCEISGAAGKAALSVPSGGTVAINVFPGRTLKVRGGDGNGASGAGPGILVPANSTLYLLGEGTIVAQGGNAGAGGNGGNGGIARVEDETSSAGAGGNGGAGGGGAAPGIGTMGGNGGAEKLGPTIAVRDTSWDSFPQNGNDGYAGNAGATSAAMGKVVILGSLVVRTAGGTAGSGGGAGSTDGGTDENWGARWYTAGGGGGGGGGAGGGAPSYGIGAGGGGGGSGGTGGTGGFQDTTVGKTGKRHPNGGGGAGGTGGSAGGSGGTSNPDRPADSPSFSSSRHGGGGGAGGAAGGRGGDGTLVIGSSVQFDSSPRRASNTSLSQADSSLYDTEISFYSEGQKVGTASASLMRTMPGAADVSRNGYRFLGYFTKEEGGTCVYGPDGSASSPVWESADESVSLYAHWEIAPTMLVVNTNEEGEKLGGGKVTLRDAVRALYDNPDLCGTGGVRRIEFSLPAEDNVITLTNTIVVTGGTVPFEIDGVNGGNGVTIAAQGGGFSLLQLSGVDITLESINFRNCQERAVVHSGGFLTIDDCSFIGNKGALQCGEKSVLVVLNSTFADNEAESTGGAVVMSTDSVFASFVNSTFSRNKANLGSAVASSTDLVFIHCTLVPGDANTLVSADGFEVGFLNTLVARPSGGVAVSAAETTSICSSVGTQDESDILNTVQADDFLGVRQIWYEPVQSSTSGNRDAARIYYDHGLENIAISTNGVKVAVYGNPDRATMLLGIDQLHTARMAPVRGSIRLATGSQPPVVNLEGVAWGMTNASVTATAIVTYDDDTVSEVPVALRTNADAVFGASVEVDGSDLYTHNATVVRVPELPGEPEVSVATSPYALVASSASAIATDDSEVYLEGGEIGVTTMRADSLVVNRLAVGGDSFSAGSLAGFKDITLDDVNMRGGALRLLGSKSKDGGSQMANLANKTVGGGDDEDAGSVANGSKTWTARYDGFVQVRVEAEHSSTCRVGLTVGDVTVTPVAAIGTSGKRTPIWTVPVRKDETVTLTASGSTVGYKTQFVYFGVKE